MAEQGSQSNGNGGSSITNGDGGSGDRRFSLEKLYVKDMSFEVPNAPDIYNLAQVESEIEMNLKNSHQAIGEGLYEVVLHISLHAKHGDKTLFMLELDQAGQFTMLGLPEDTMRQVVSTTCPATLFPYAREAISAAIGRGGFPAILLQPINFDALYATAEANQQQPQA
jgi:preprotein translocase subunit SecB